MATGGEETDVQIFDKRESNIVRKTFNIHTGNIFILFNKPFLTSDRYYIDFINCVRWSPSGDMIASASWDKTVVLLDVKTGTKLYT